MIWRCLGLTDKSDEDKSDDQTPSTGDAVDHECRVAGIT